MKTQAQKVGKHIRRLNELLEVDGTRYSDHNETITLDLLKALKALEDTIRGPVFTTNAVDRAVNDIKDEEW